MTSDPRIRHTAVVMAAMEILPAQPSDLTGILRDPDQFRSLVDRESHADNSDLLKYLLEGIDQARVEHWHKCIDQLVADGVATPVLAADLSGESAYPYRLLQCWDAPPVLFATATPIERDRSHRTVAIIGSRKTSDETLTAAHQLGADLARAGVSVVSGLALGVDAAAHEGALAANGHTIAVLGTGIRQVYPAQNEQLAERIRHTGSLVSQFAPSAPRTRSSFLQRNNVIAGLSDVSVVMAGEERSGSNHEIRQAMGYGRTVLMWKPSLDKQPWARQLSESGRASFIQSANDVFSVLDAASNE